jgi:hypothetical protein
MAGTAAVLLPWLRSAPSGETDLLAAAAGAGATDMPLRIGPGGLFPSCPGIALLARARGAGSEAAGVLWAEELLFMRCKKPIFFFLTTSVPTVATEARKGTQHTSQSTKGKYSRPEAKKIIPSGH